MTLTTRWWWIRHAPVRANGRIYGQGDLPADCTDAAAFRSLAQILPREPIWVVSHLQRTHQTAQAILDHRDEEPDFVIEPRLVEQHFGDWQGLTHDELAARREGDWHRFWLAPADEAPPNGESFVQVLARVATAVQELSAAHGGREIVCVSHGGTIRAALALALDLQPERALALSVDNCSLTQIDHIAGAASSRTTRQEQSVWQVVRVNQSPGYGS